MRPKARFSGPAAHARLPVREAALAVGVFFVTENCAGHNGDENDPAPDDLPSHKMGRERHVHGALMGKKSSALEGHVADHDCSEVHTTE